MIKEFMPNITVTYPSFQDGKRQLCPILNDVHT